ncbi:MAG: hypothetical protein LBC27_07685 [Spirochaetaceae bacterium]|jgi:hypothetical protein|nr:hypothetical protein [Spirochaetaceae bacterium]
MNTNLLNIVKRIVAEQGEAVLGDPARLKPFIKSYAQTVPQDERRAFGRCVETGFYRRVKAASTAEERRRLKAELAAQLQKATEMNGALCSGAVDVLDAAVPLTGSRLAQDGALPASGQIPAIPRITKRTLIFAIAAGLGAFAGTLVSRPLMSGITRDSLGLIISIGLWAGLMGLGISVALIAAQTFYLKKKFVIGAVIKSALIGIAVGATIGALAQFIYNFTQHISPAIQVISRVICWGLLGWGLGWGVSFYVPNYPAKRAMLAGLAGGIIGGVLCVTLETTAFSMLSELMLGFVIGLAISWVEEALREAWLTVIWGPKETTTISLGTKPVVFGSTAEADVYLPPGRGDVKPPPVRAVVSIENEQVVLEDRAANRRSVLQNNSEITLDRLRVIVNMKH